MAKLTLLQQKNRPIHELTFGTRKSVVARTYCGVDPCRKGVKVAGVHIGVLEPTCKECLKIKREREGV